MQTKFDINEEVFIINGKTIENTSVTSINITYNGNIIYYFADIPCERFEKQVYPSVQKAKIGKLLLSTNWLKMYKYVQRKGL